MLPYFLRAEHQERGADDHHAVGGPLNVSDVTQTHSVSDAVIEACMEAGIPRNDDINGADQEGVGYYQLTVKNGQRCSAAVAYLHPAMGRSNLRVRDQSPAFPRSCSRASARSGSSSTRAARSAGPGPPAR